MQNTFGRLFCFTSFGESHGEAVGCVVDGCPAGIPLQPEDIQTRLDRRRPGQSRWVTQRTEADQVHIMSGVYEGRTTGHPVLLLVQNHNQRSKDYSQIEKVFRPGHADATYTAKYGIRDPRGGGRSSARETIARVAAGAVAERLLAYHPETSDIKIRAGLVALGPESIDPANWDDDETDRNAFFCPDADAVPRFSAALEQAMAEKDSLGGIVEVRCQGVPPGLGEPVYDKLDGRIGAAFLGVNAVKGVEIGDGFSVARMRGTENNDPMRAPASGRLADAFVTNHSGGVLGGISTGAPLVARCAFKPTPSIACSQETVNTDLENCVLSLGGRHDPAVCIRAVPVLEAMMACILADFWLLARARRP